MFYGNTAALPPTLTDVTDLPPVDPTFTRVAMAADHELVEVLREDFTTSPFIVAVLDGLAVAS